VMVVGMILAVGSRSKGPSESEMQLFVVLPWLATGLFFSLGVLFTVWGAVQANDGKVWRIPLIGGLVARITGTR
jgi:uncharacterized Tic20 family protein